MRQGHTCNCSAPIIRNETVAAAAVEGTYHDQLLLYLRVCRVLYKTGRDYSDLIVLSEREKTNLDALTIDEVLASAASPVVSRGKSAYRGVCSNSNRWKARIRIGGTYKSLGTFENEEDAAVAYDRAALTRDGRHAVFSFSFLTAVENMPYIVGRIFPKWFYSL
jgi:hypothetical protein